MKIYTISNSRPDFIELQMASFCKYLAEPFEFTVFDNTILDPEHKADGLYIDRVCAALGIQNIPIQMNKDLADRCQALETSCRLFSGAQTYMNPNVANAYALCWAWENVIAKANDTICLLDSDVFLTAPINFSSHLVDHDLCYIPQTRPGIDGEYIWNAFVLANLPKLPEVETLNWYCGKINGVPVDVSGQTSLYLKAHPEIKASKIQPAYTEFDSTVSFQPADYETFWIHGQGGVLHYRSGSNWNGRSKNYHEEKTKWLKRQIAL